MLAVRIVLEKFSIRPALGYNYNALFDCWVEHLRQPVNAKQRGMYASTSVYVSTLLHRLGQLP